ncbi:hypothetical protein V496_02543 [Pseudogymnoascus sp. VKM F-4515 (FW-2607)]|nr:hypothetical protein V496_02543 [Pseudogymnoascus sp. VKM F-4515 (FW-2607)]
MTDRTPGPDWGDDDGDDDDIQAGPPDETPRPSYPALLPPPPRTSAPPPRRVFITDEDALIILRLCILNADAYPAQTAAAFWRHVTFDFHQETGKEHTNLSRVIARRIRLRRITLDSLGSGEIDSATEITTAEDAWINILDEENRILSERRARQATVQGESQASYDARESLLFTQTKKRRLEATPIRPRSRVSNGVIIVSDDDHSSDEETPDPLPPPTPRSSTP